MVYGNISVQKPMRAMSLKSSDYIILVGSSRSGLIIIPLFLWFRPGKEKSFSVDTEDALIRGERGGLGVGDPPSHLYQEEACRQYDLCAYKLTPVQGS